ncbi:DUF4469 domain-containing protein [Treponema sp. R80B11-R83G3]
MLFSFFSFHFSFSIHPISFRFRTQNKLRKLAEQIKVAGDDPGIGVFIMDENGGNLTKVTKLAENTPSKIIGIIPHTPSSVVHLEIRTQFSGSDKYLKTIRVIKPNFTLLEP